MSAPARVRTVTVLTHQRPAQTADAVAALRAVAERVGATLRFDPEETGKHGLVTEDGCVLCDAPVTDDVDLCIVLGGDGTIALELPHGQQAAINDVSINRRVGRRVATIAYGVGGQDVGAVRCDGLVVATPAGSTGYNLANGGPVLAWGVEGYVVSFIAPHSLTARALVVAPDDELQVFNRGRDPVDIAVDGRPIGELAPGDVFTSRFVREAADLAQVPGSSFYRRISEKFGRLAR